MKKITLLSVMAGLCLYVNAQQPKIKPLTVGDTVPDILFGYLLNASQPTMNLYAFKGKNIIIDLWSRHCTACISAFPKMEKLQQQYASQLQVILANPHDGGYKNEVMALLDGVKSRTGYYPALPISLNDTLLNYYFPHAGVPHYIWINKNLQIAAITGLGEVTERNIKQFLSGRPMNLAIKDAPAFKKDLLQLLREGDLPAGSLLSYSLFATYQPGSNLASGSQKAADGSIGTFFAINRPLSFFIRMAYGSQLGKLPSNRVLNYPPHADARYAYQLQPGTRVFNLDQLEPYVRADLAKTFGIKGKLVQKERDCWVIKSIQNMDRLNATGTQVQVNMNNSDIHKFLHGLSLSVVIKYLDRMQLPLLDESGRGQQVIDLSFPAGLQLTNDEQLVGWLRQCGFQIEKQLRRITVFEFKPNN